MSPENFLFVLNDAPTRVSAHHCSFHFLYVSKACTFDLSKGPYFSPLVQGRHVRFAPPSLLRWGTFHPLQAFAKWFDPPFLDCCSFILSPPDRRPGLLYEVLSADCPRRIRLFFAGPIGEGRVGGFAWRQAPNNLPPLFLCCFLFAGAAALLAFDGFPRGETRPPVLNRRKLSRAGWSVGRDRGGLSSPLHLLSPY